MARTNANYGKLAAGYLFPEIARRTNAFKEKHPGVEVIRLGIGDTTEPLTPSVLAGLRRGVEKLGDVATYTGYGAEQGNKDLRNAIAHSYEERGVQLDQDAVFVSDGAKPDSANIQSIFGLDNVVALQDPAYPVYVDSNVIAGRTGSFDTEKMQYKGICYMPCTQDNGFVPFPPETKVDLIYLCSPNNPTGAVTDHSALKEFVDYANKFRAVIIFDSAYASYISDPSLPRSIYEIDGAKECAIEIGSFSKSVGFTGVRLGWTIVPKELMTEDAPAGRVNALWNRRQTTMFNGASNIAQEGGLAALSEEGLAESQATVRYYMENARLIREGLAEKGFTIFGGVNAPYLWVKTPNGMPSWDFFNKVLEEAHVVITPGVGFGPSGEGFFRISAFGHRENAIKATESIKKSLRV